MDAYEIQTESFSGPVGKLLELIEEKKLDITRMSLAQVTADFLRYVGKLQEAVKISPESEREDPASIRLLADFLSVAAQLILIKSKAILPDSSFTEEEEQSIRYLEQRVALYQRAKPIFSTLKNFWGNSGQSFSRPMLSSLPPVFYPSKNTTLVSLSASFAGALKMLGSFVMETEQVKRQIFTMESKIREISERIAQGIKKFSDMISRKTKEEAIVIFLALLHLLGDKTVRADQSGLFEEINLGRGK